MKKLNEQEGFWAGRFGDEYIERNQSSEYLAANIDFFSKSLKSTSKISSCIELGANVGMNLRALKLLYPAMTQHGLEINSKAATHLRSFLGDKKVFETSISDFKTELQWDLVIVKGVLIHIDPLQLEATYSVIASLTSKYVLIAEYYNLAPVEIDYRGHKNKMFKRDFAGEFMKSFPEFKLIDYGFVYHGDSKFPQDDITWFLMGKG